MKNATSNVIVSFIVAIILALGVVALAYFGLLPGLYTATGIAVELSILMLILLFVAVAVSACKCLSHIRYALCVYGKCMAITLVISILVGMTFLCLPVMELCLALYLFLLFVSTAAFLVSLFMLIGIIYSGADKNCPPHPCTSTAGASKFIDEF